MAAFVKGFGCRLVDLNQLHPIDRPSKCIISRTGWMQPMAIQSPHVRWFADLRNTDVPEVGGKNASLGELYSALAHEGICVPVPPAVFGTPD